MKRLIIFILLLTTITLAQDYTGSVQSAKNSTTTLLAKGGVFTGTAELTRGYNSISITVRSDSASATNGLVVRFGNSSTITTATAIKTYKFSYTAGDTTYTKVIPVEGPYFQVLYTNNASYAQHKFYLTTMLHKGMSLPLTTSAKLDVEGTVSLTLTQAQIDSLQKISQFPNGQTYANVRDSWQWARMRTVFADSVRTDSISVVRSRDTVSIVATEWAKVTISVAAGDSVSFAIGTTAPSNYWEWQTIRNKETYVSEKLNFVYFTKVFIKGAGYPNNIESYQVIIEGF